MAQAKTGTGKTLAFLVPAIQNILNDPTLKNASLSRDADASDIRALIISPTRELAEQIAVEARKVTDNTGIQVQTAVGGTGKAIGLQRIRREGCHLLIGTPGRLKDILSDPQAGVSIPKLNTLILDEADRLLDDGFAAEIMDIETLLPSTRTVDRQTLMFSATVPKEVMSMVRRMMKPDFKFVKTVRDDEIPTHLTVPQRKVELNGYENALPAVLELVKEYQARAAADPNLQPFKAIVYFNTTASVKLASAAFGFIRRGRSLGQLYTFELHARLTQQARTRFANNFRNAEEAILFSSDVTARGMDFPNVTHVIQVGLPGSRDIYIHRLGRTARANKTGEGWIFYDPRERRACHSRTYDLPLQDDATLSTATVDMSQSLEGVDPKTAANIEEVMTAMSQVADDYKDDAYRAQFGSFKSSFPSDRDMVESINDTALLGWRLPEVPKMAPNLVRTLGLDRVPGLNIGVDPNRYDRPHRSDDFNSRGPFDRRDNNRGRMFDRHDNNRGGMFDRKDSRGGFSRREPRREPRRAFAHRDWDAALY